MLSSLKNDKLMLRKIRTIFAILFLVCITLLFLDFTGVTHTYLGWMAKLQFLPALLALNVGVIGLLLVLTLVFGRIYCSVICPMGVFQDVIAWLGKRFRSKKSRKMPYSFNRSIAGETTCWPTLQLIMKAIPFMRWRFGCDHYQRC